MEVYEPLLWYNSYRNQFVPELATAYHLSSDARTLTFTLRRGVRWSDGSPFTAADVAFTLRLIMTHPDIDANLLSSMIRRVSAKGNVVTIQLLHRNSTAPYYIGSQTPMLPMHVWKRVTNPANFIVTNPVTTGPFVLGSFSPQLIILKRNPDYWNAPRPYISEVAMPLYLSDASAEAAGFNSPTSWDFSTDYVAGVLKSLIKKDPSRFHAWYPFPESTTYDLFPNDERYPYSLRSLRLAMSDVIHRRDLARLDYSGEVQPANPVGLPSQPGLRSVLNNPLLREYRFPSSAARARAVLRQGGFHWNSQGDLIDPKGQLVQTVIKVDTVLGPWVETVQGVAQELDSLGIKASVQTVSNAAMPSTMADGDFDLAMYWLGSGYGAFGQYDSALSSTFTAPEGKPAVGDFERWRNSETDRLLTQYGETSSAATQRQDILKLESIVARDVPFIPVYGAPAWEEYNTTRFVGWPTAKKSYAAMTDQFAIQYILGDYVRPR